MTIRLATINDIPDIVKIYDELISLEEKGSCKTGWITSASDNEVMVLHTLSISSAFSSKGYGKDFVHFYENYALMNGCNLLRIDTNV